MTESAPSGKSGSAASCRDGIPLENLTIPIEAGLRSFARAM
jgi:hypothetical protein